jgi:hypothetical protein
VGGISVLNLVRQLLFAFLLVSISGLELAAQQPTQTQTQEVQVEYHINRKWSVSGNRDQNAGFGVDGRYHKDFQALPVVRTSGLQPPVRLKAYFTRPACKLILSPPAGPVIANQAPAVF